MCLHRLPSVAGPARAATRPAVGPGARPSEGLFPFASAASSDLTTDGSCRTRPFPADFRGRSDPVTRRVQPRGRRGAAVPVPCCARSPAASLWEGPRAAPPSPLCPRRPVPIPLGHQDHSATPRFPCIKPTLSGGLWLFVLSRFFLIVSLLHVTEKSFFHVNHFVNNSPDLPRVWLAFTCRNCFFLQATVLPASGPRVLAAVTVHPLSVADCVGSGSDREVSGCSQK